VVESGPAFYRKTSMNTSTLNPAVSRTHALERIDKVIGALVLASRVLLAALAVLVLAS
jgi:hypothetical protein